MGIKASQILQRTITDFTKHPEHWVQGTFGRDFKKHFGSWEAQEAAEEKFDAERPIRSQLPIVTEPGDGKFTAEDIFDFDFDPLARQPQQYCGLGGIQQSAFRMNKKKFWDWDFQRELAVVGVYLNAEAKKRTYTCKERCYDDGSGKLVTQERHFGGFIDFNDYNNEYSRKGDRTTVEDVVALFKVVLKQLKVREAKLAARREREAAKRAAA